MAALPDDYTLDVSDPQVAVHFPADPGGFFYHHRLLLAKLSAGRWVASSPDHELEVVDLNTQRHRILTRRAPFPADIRDVVYAFDPINKVDLDRIKRQARAMVVVLGDDDGEEMDETVWVFADSDSNRLGNTLTVDQLQHANLLGSRGLVEIDGTVEAIEELSSGDVEKFVEKKKGQLGDLRVIGSHKDDKDRRFIPFPDAMGLLRQSDFPDWGFAGPRAAREFLTSIYESGVDLGAYHLQWAKNSNVNTHSSVCHEHKNLLECIRLGLLRDQLDLSNLLMAEMMIRRVVQLEVAVSRNNTAPDFAGLDVLLESPLTEGGGASARALDEWVTSRLKEKAQIAKQTRLFREESSYSSRAKSSTTTEETANPWRRKKKAKAKASTSKEAGAGDS